MMRFFLGLSLLFSIAQSCPSSFLIAFDASSASSSEAYAVDELKTFLSSFTQVDVKTPEEAKGEDSFIAVGTDASFKMGVISPDDLSDDLGDEGYIMRGDGSSVALSGLADAPRGTLYAVYEFLREIGFKFVSSDTTVTPACPGALPKIDKTFNPLFEYRDNNQDGITTNIDFAVRIGNNRGNFDYAHGSTVLYADPPGFVHTSYHLLGSDNNQPPADLFESNNEWFWPHDDETAYGQLCWSNSSLQSYLIERVRDILTENPDATIISVSQNDNGNYCNDTADAAIIEGEGSPIGPLLRAVNNIADAIAEDFPHVAVDTLAYQYTRAAPKVTVPRPNVMVRLCSIECNFAKPLTDSTNEAFQRDILAWNEISDRLYIWDYVTNFQGYLTPFPNWKVLAANIRFFQQHGVVGLFEEGGYQGPGSDMGPLKDYVIGRMMMEPDIVDDDALIDEFLDAYFGAAADKVRVYMETMEQSVADTEFYMGESFGPDAEFLTPEALLTSAKAFTEGEELVKGDDALLGHIEVAKLSVYYVTLQRWDEIYGWATDNGVAWPIEGTKEEAYDEFARIYDEQDITHLREAQEGIDWFHDAVFGA